MGIVLEDNAVVQHGAKANYTLNRLTARCHCKPAVRLAR